MRLPLRLMPGQFAPADNRQINAYYCRAPMQIDHPADPITLTACVDAIAQPGANTMGLAR